MRGRWWNWERIWWRRVAAPVPVHAPRLLETVQLMLGHQVGELRRFPWQPPRPGARRDGDDLGVPARVREGFEVAEGHVAMNVEMYHANAEYYRTALRRIDG